MNLKARAFGGWILDTTARLLAFRGWVATDSFISVEPASAEVGIESLNIYGITSLEELLIAYSNIPENTLIFAETTIAP